MKPKNSHTLLFLLQADNKILLAMKKRGFGAGYWNGVGGKIEPNETIEQAAIRECREEISVTPKQIFKVAVHNFFLAEDSYETQVHTFFCKNWAGIPTETEEMAPKWFKLSSIPYEKMWPDDIFWLPAALMGKKMETRFTFDKQTRLVDSQIKIVTKLSK